MTSNVGIAELKAHLSEYVRAAQKGSEIIIKDRQTPVAKLVPIDQPQMIENIRYATRSVAEAEQMLDADRSGPLIPRDVFERILEEERADRSDEWIITGT
jgi:prevent-host-death family protein